MEKQLPHSFLDTYPKGDEGAIDLILEKRLAGSPYQVVVLDDDPTGIQTVHDISVYTDWSYESIKQGFLEANQLFYILTNSRSFSEEQTRKAHMEMASVIQKVSEELQKPYILVSRSDSTLRGHYPLETEVLKEVIEEQSRDPFDGEILCFFFKEGGRYTIDNVHYVQYGDQLIPAGETEFAKDKTFGYQSSNLCRYVEEKTEGRYSADQVLSITLDELRKMDLAGIEAKLLKAENFQKIVVNAIDDYDLKVFSAAFYAAVQKGKRYMFRSAAGLVRALCGVKPRALLSYDELVDPGNRNGGIVLVGSHVNKTTRQVEALEKGCKDVAFVEFNQHLVLQEGGLEEEARRVIKQTEHNIEKGITTVVYTRREKFDLDTDDPQAQLAVSVRISDAVTSVIGNLSVTPSFIVAKGGITSSDVGTKALQVKRATVAGQILPGIPVWKTGPESKFPGLPYIIFPGNVGDDNALQVIVENLQGRKSK